MGPAVNQFVFPFAMVAIVLFAVSGIIWLFWCHGIDKIRHPEEWKNAGSSGERIVYRELVDKFHVPENQIFRNVYIPTKNGKTSEIDILVVSKKGLMIFECKNYGGNVYGDAKKQKWVQYIGRQKHYFYNPLLQNKNHVKNLRSFLGKEFGDIPMVPFVTTISRGNWKVRNLGVDDYFLGVNCHFKDVYAGLPESKAMAKCFKVIIGKLAPLSRPEQEVRENHIKQIKNSAK